MGVRVKRFANTANAVNDPIFGDSTQEQRETTFDGQTFHWGPGQIRNFLDDGVGAGHARFGRGLASTIQESSTPFGSSRS